MEFTEEEKEQLNAFMEAFAQLIHGELDECLRCHEQFTTLEQHGRCVYAYPCGHRQYQGSLPERWKPKKAG